LGLDWSKSTPDAVDGAPAEDEPAALAQAAPAIFTETATPQEALPAAAVEAEVAAPASPADAHTPAEVNAGTVQEAEVAQAVQPAIADAASHAVEPQPESTRASKPARPTPDWTSKAEPGRAEHKETVAKPFDGGAQVRTPEPAEVPAPVEAAAAEIEAVPAGAAATPLDLAPAEAEAEPGEQPAGEAAKPVAEPARSAAEPVPSHLIFDIPAVSDEAPAARQSDPAAWPPLGAKWPAPKSQGRAWPAPEAPSLPAALAALDGPAPVMAQMWVQSSQEVLNRGAVRVCHHCALPLSTQARFCRRCGTKQA